MSYKFWPETHARDPPHETPLLKMFFRSILGTYCYYYYYHHHHFETLSVQRRGRVRVRPLLGWITHIVAISASGTLPGILRGRTVVVQYYDNNNISWPSFQVNHTSRLSEFVPPRAVFAENLQSVDHTTIYIIHILFLYIHNIIYTCINCLTRWCTPRKPPHSHCVHILHPCRARIAYSLYQGTYNMCTEFYIIYCNAAVTIASAVGRQVSSLRPCYGASIFPRRTLFHEWKKNHDVILKSKQWRYEKLDFGIWAGKNHAPTFFLFKIKTPSRR